MWTRQDQEKMTNGVIFLLKSWVRLKPDENQCFRVRTGTLHSKFISRSQEDDMSRRNACESPEPLVKQMICTVDCQSDEADSEEEIELLFKKWGAWDREVFDFPFSKAGN